MISYRSLLYNTTVLHDSCSDSVPRLNIAVIFRAIVSFFNKLDLLKFRLNGLVIVPDLQNCFSKDRLCTVPWWFLYYSLKCFLLYELECGKYIKQFPLLQHSTQGAPAYCCSLKLYCTIEQTVISRLSIYSTKTQLQHRYTIYCTYINYPRWTVCFKKKADLILQVDHLILLFISIIVDFSSNSFNKNKL